MNEIVYTGSLILSGAIGFLVGLSELVNRYTSFNKIFKNIYSWIYMIINLSAGSLAYYLIKKYQISIGTISNHEIGVCLFAGVGAMAFLRSSIFNYKTSNDQIISIGPAAILNIFLKASEREFDRIISNDNVIRIAKLMQNVKFLSASKDLPLIILASMRVLDSQEQKTLSDDILKLVNDTTSTTEAKNIALGCILIKYTGFTLLSTAVESLRAIYDTFTKSNLNKISSLQEKLKAL